MNCYMYVQSLKIPNFWIGQDRPPKVIAMNYDQSLWKLMEGT